MGGNASAETAYMSPPRLSVSASSPLEQQVGQVLVVQGKAMSGDGPQVSRCCGWPRKQRCSSPRRSLKWVATRRLKRPQPVSAAGCRPIRTRGSCPTSGIPTVSMGLGPLNAIYQARFNHYLHDRGAFLEGRLTAEQLDGFRQEHSQCRRRVAVLSAPAAHARLLEFPPCRWVWARSSPRRSTGSDRPPTGYRRPALPGPVSRSFPDLGPPPSAAAFLSMRSQSC